MDVRWTRRARRRLDQHTDYIAQHNVKAAYDLLQRIRHDVDGLADNPLMGREGRYIVVYRVRGQIVQISSVHDGRRPWPATAADL